MSEHYDRSTPIAKGYVDDVAILLVMLIVLVAAFLLVDSLWSDSKIRDLQRRVGQLEAMTEVKE